MANKGPAFEAIKNKVVLCERCGGKLGLELRAAGLTAHVSECQNRAIPPKKKPSPMRWGVAVGRCVNHL